MAHSVGAADISQCLACFASGEGRMLAAFAASITRFRLYCFARTMTQPGANGIVTVRAGGDGMGIALVIRLSSGLGLEARGIWQSSPRASLLSAPYHSC
jgi:hypothetical protein